MWFRYLYFLMKMFLYVSHRSVLAADNLAFIPDSSSTASTPPAAKMSRRPSYRRVGKEPSNSSGRVRVGDVTAALSAALGNSGLLVNEVNME